MMAQAQMQLNQQQTEQPIVGEAEVEAAEKEMEEPEEPEEREK
jgi:hypothetical protein